ncbi:MAG: hypothetical protein GY820_08700 [Gammaproteobacteria bacterium]|nr:hypothetical protein [Gammaproteobacteria bacterium]
MENRNKLGFNGIDEVTAQRYRSEKVIYVSDPVDDEVNLGELIRKLSTEWKTMALVMVLGLLVSWAGSMHLTRSYLVEAIIRLPNINEIGDLGDQELFDVSPRIAFARYVDQLTLPSTQSDVFEESKLFAEISEDSELSSNQIFFSIRDGLLISRVKRSHYELDKTEKTPFKEISISLQSSKPELAAEYLQQLTDKAHSNALDNLFRDTAVTKDNRIREIEDQLNFMTKAADASRKAEITRLEEKNQGLIVGLKMQIALKIEHARKVRENKVIQVTEALNTANGLEIVQPVTWDDLRASREISQIINEFGGTDKSMPRYFQGTRILTAELNRLKSRKDDRPFIKDLPDIQKQISLLENDPKIAALRVRKDDTIYVEKFDELQQQLAQLIQTPVKFENVQLAVVSQQAIVSPTPTRNPLLIMSIGLLLSSMAALFIAGIRSSFRE